MISAVILTHNSERILKTALDSVNWCEECVVVDDASTDLTVTLAKKQGARVFERKLERDFAAQRNFGLEKANGEWVLFLDADELVTPELRDEVREAVKDSAVSGYYFTRKDFLWGRGLAYGETATVKLLRLAKKNSGIWERPVHEVWHIKGIIKILTHPLHHFPHPDVAQFLSSINWYSTLNAQYLHSTHATGDWWRIVAYPVAKFFRNYVWLQGFRDGTPGAIVALMMSMHSYLTRAKYWQLVHKPHEQ